MKKHLSIISFHPNSLIKFKKLNQSELEKIENIELMRAIENEMNLEHLKWKVQFCNWCKRWFFKSFDFNA